MGLFNRLKGISEPVDAEFRIVACSSNSGGAVYENCTMDGVVSGPGFDPVPVHHTSMVTPTAKWPYPGVVLPVTVDRQHPDRLKINWDAVPTSGDVARALAAQQAQQMSAAAGQNAQATPTANAAPSVAPAVAGLPPQYQSMIGDIVARAQAAGATVTTSYETQVVGAPGRAAPGMPGGGLTQAESAQAMSGGGAAIGLQATVATVLAAHEIVVPAGVPGAAPGGVWDLTLDVTANPGYTTVLRINFSSPEKRQQIAVVGRSLPVQADPSRHDRIAIDTSRL
jgi:hypothetical protein